MHVRRIAYALGAEVTGVDLSQPLDERAIDEIRKAWLEHLVLCFPKQELDRSQFLAFAQNFGEIEVAVNPSSDRGAPEVTLLTEKPVPGARHHGYKNGQIWHSDQSITTRPTSASFLICREIPEAGGDTMFANAYMAWDALSPAMQRVLERLSAVHDQELSVRPEVAHLTRRQGPAELLQSLAIERAKMYPPVVQPAVRVHPETQRKALYLGERVRRFYGMTDEESAPLLSFLNNHAASYEFVFRKRWSVGDVVMWDNRCTLHMALCDYDLARDPRLMERCAVQGEPSGEPYDPQAEAAAPSVQPA